MAKKKAAKKKAAKKKSAKKKSTKKKKSAKKVTITYKCSNGCKADKKFAHMAPGDSVTLDARGTDAYIDFLTRTPFVSKHMHIVVLNGSPEHEVVASNASGVYEYTLDCRNPSCRSSVNNPKMIVP